MQMPLRVLYSTFAFVQSRAPLFFILVGAFLLVEGVPLLWGGGSSLLKEISSVFSAGLIVCGAGLLIWRHQEHIDRKFYGIGAGIAVVLAWVITHALSAGNLTVTALSGTAFEVGTVMSIFVFAMSFFAGFVCFRAGIIRTLRVAIMTGGAIAFAAVTLSVLFGAEGLARIFGDWFNTQLVFGFIFLTALFLGMEEKKNILRGAARVVTYGCAVALAFFAPPMLLFSLGLIGALFMFVVKADTRIFSSAAVFLLIAAALIKGLLGLSFEGDAVFQEIRPSAPATLHVLSKEFTVTTPSLFLGSGPNSFFEVWNRYRPPLVAASPLWDTDITKGHSLALLILLEYGVIFAGALILLCIFAIVRVLRIYGEEAGETKDLSLLWALAIVLFATPWSFFYVPSQTFLIIVALAAGVCASTAQRSDVVLARELRRKWAAGLSALVVFGAGIFLVSTSVLRLASTHLYERALFVLSQGTDSKEGERLLRSSFDLEALPPTAREIVRMNDENITRILEHSEGVALSIEAGRALDTLTKENVNIAGAAVASDKKDYRNWLVYAKAQLTRGVLFSDSNTLNASLKNFEAARAWAPTNPRLLFEGSRAYLAAGDREEALRWLREAVRLKPDYTEAAKLLGTMQAS